VEIAGAGLRGRVVPEPHRRLQREDEHDSAL
jgi:hypothetical protein